MLTSPALTARTLLGVLALINAPILFAQTTPAKEEAEVFTLDKMIVEGESKKISQAYTPMKSGAALLDTPASVSIATKELLEAQGATSLQDSIRNISGLMHEGNNYGIGDQLAIRGQSVSYTYDGLDAGSGGSGGGSGATVRSLTNVERLEVLKGPAGTLYGIGAAGGIVNLVEKRPQATAARKFETYLGRWNTYGAQLDLTGPLSEKLSYRVIASTRESDGYRNFTEDRTELYPSLMFKPNRDHTLLFTAAYIADKVQVDSNGHPVRIYDIRSTVPANVPAEDATLPNIPNGPGGLQLTDAQRQQLLDSLAAGDGGQPYDLGEASLISPLTRPTEGEEFRVKFRHDWTLSENTAFAHYAQFRSYESDYVRTTGAFNYVYWNRTNVINAVPRAPLVINGVLYPFALRRTEYRKLDFAEDSVQYFAEAKNRFEFAKTKHEVLATTYGEWRDYKTKGWSLYDGDDARSAANPVPYILDMRNPNWPTGRFEDYAFVTTSDYTKDVTAYGVGLQDVITLPHDITVRLAGGWNQIDQDYDNNFFTVGADPIPVSSKDQGLLYNAGVSWRMLPNTALFVAAAQGRTALSVTGSVVLTNQPPDSESENYEVGVKQEYLGGKLALSAAYFETSRTNLRYANPLYDSNPSSPTYNITVDPFRYDGNEETKGGELDLNVNITQRWMINLNGTYQDAHTQQNPGLGTVTGLKKGVPRVFASIWVQHTLAPKVFGGKLTLGGGVRHNGRRTINDTSFGIAQAYVPRYTTVDGILRFDSASFWSVQVNANNLTDERYYELAQFLGGRPGEPLNATVTFTAKF
ncbi:TonB-dependent receptor [Oleiharenicola lentus]|uniref:TonB-dependent receptor n=1 Tax=Oleiharenicola lentus TaxID=2508720 RepID=UPI003F670155